MKKLLLVLATSMLVLSACHKTTEDSVTNPSTPRDQQTKETTKGNNQLFSLPSGLLSKGSFPRKRIQGCSRPITDGCYGCSHGRASVV